MGSSTDWKGDTFADGSYHRIQIFYMERGAGASNLKIRFNLKTIPDGQLSVRKNVENYYAPQLADTTYTMQVMVDDSPYSGMPYTIFGTDQTGKTDENGYLHLKNNQTAVFADLTVGNKIQVKEIGASDTEEGSEISDRYDIDCSVADSSGAPVAGSSVKNGVATATMPAYGSIVVTVTNTATFTRPLMLVKNFSGTEDNSPPENFQATYFLYEVDADGYLSKEPVGSICYSDMTKAEDGKSASYIFWLDVNKKYTIVEDFGDNDNKSETADLKWKKVIVETNDPAEGTDSNEGIVYLEKTDATLLNQSESNPVDTITMTNYYSAPTIDITVTKVDSADNAIRLPNAEFYVSKTMTGNAESPVYYYKYDEQNDITTWVPSQNNATKLISSPANDGYGTFCIHNLEDGAYTLIEVKAPDGYQLPTSNITFTVMDGEVKSTSSGNSVDSGTSINVPNTSGGTVLPETGGPGTTLMSISGLLIVAAAVGGGYGLRRRRGKEGR